jgi:neutral trehalase
MCVLSCSRWKVCFLLALIFACVFNSARGEERKRRKFTLAEKNIQHAKENLPRQMFTESPKLTTQIHNLYNDCLFDKVWEPALPGLPYKWFSISGARDRAYGKCQLMWDTMFILNAWAPLDDNELIHDVFRNYWNVIDNNPEAPKGSYRYGMVPCTTNPDLPQPGYSQIPILAWGCLMVYNQTNDKELLDLCVPYLDAFLTWYATERDVDDDGLIEYGAYKKSSIGDMVQTARFETFDFHATLDNLKMTTHPTRGTGGAWYGNIEGVDQTCFLAMSERAMIEMCQITGRVEMMKKYQGNLAKRTKAIREKMWDPETKFFYSLDRDTDKKIHIRTIQGFLPLTAGLASDEQAEELVKQLTDPSLFWSKYPVTTSAMDEPTFKPDGFWRGDMWPPTNYLIALGLNRYGYYDVAIELANKMQELVGKYDGHAYERYNGVAGVGLGVKDYCWGVVTWSIAVNTIYGIQEDYRTIVIPPNAKGRRLKLGKMEVRYPTDTSVELKTDFQREFKVVFPAGNEKIKVQCNGMTVEYKNVANEAPEITFTAMPGKTYIVSQDRCATELIR